MDIGLAGSTFLGLGEHRPHEVLRLAHAHSLDGFFFPSPFAVSAALDPGALRDTRTLAEDLGLYLEVGLGLINPDRAAELPAVVNLGDGDFRLGLERLIRACRAIGCTDLWAYTGIDRFSATRTVEEQLSRVRELLLALRPLLRDLGCRINLETHEDVTTFEVVRLVETVGPDVLGITLDVANVVVRAEDPIAATRRVAPFVRQTHLEDVILYFAEEGLVRKLCPCGAGVIDWAALIAVLRQYNPDLRLTIEPHRGQFDMAIFRPDWLARHPNLSVFELAELVRLARLCELYITDGRLVPLEQYRAPSTFEERLDALHLSLRHLRRVVADQERTASAANRS